MSAAILTLLANSATYHFTVTLPAVPTRLRLTVVAFVIWPETWPSIGALATYFTVVAGSPRSW